MQIGIHQFLNLYQKIKTPEIEEPGGKAALWSISTLKAGVLDLGKFYPGGSQQRTSLSGNNI